MTEESVVVQKIAEPLHLTITRNAKGKYQYEISVHTPDGDAAFDVGFRLDERGRAKLQGQLAGEVEGE